MANCFVIMPFRPELNYLYRIVKQYLDQAFPGLSVVRGDDQPLTVPLLQKIADFISQADVVVADCSGRNPNVFYELGLAHALEKPVVLITSESNRAGPNGHSLVRVHLLCHARSRHLPGEARNRSSEHHRQPV